MASDASSLLRPSVRPAVGEWGRQRGSKAAHLQIIVEGHSTKQAENHNPRRKDKGDKYNSYSFSL